jgi:serine/threonine protein kinase
MAASHPSADENLLFGVLALQIDFISRDQLVAAMNAWVLAKHKALGDILKEQGALDGEQHGLLSAMVQAHLKKHGNDPHKSLAAVPVSSGLKEQIQSLADPDVQASVGHLSAEVDPCATRSFSVGASTSAGTRFRILRPHAKGGLGDVFVAEDLELHREVALKEIQERHADSAGSRGRFVLEAEITGGLEHPGIVPVYGLGAYPDGRPFYAMRFIRGDNLKEAIARFHGRSRLPNGTSEGPARQAGPTFDSLEFRQLLGRFIDVCNAVAYAHSRGVLHRDLKPGNVMLGKFGETLVVDWGLAKARGEKAEPDAQARDTAALATEVTEPPLRPSSGSGVAETLAGSAIGTPAYMSPEQAAGKLDQLGPATDICSLGATLYTLLTNRSPITAGDSAEVLRKAQRGDAGFDEPEASATGIPAPLVAICRKAMSVRPQDRYATPLALAEDLEHWLADEPVKAAPDPVIVRTRRWMRKHPGPVSGIAAAVLVGIAGLAIGAVVLGEKNRLRTDANAHLDTANTELKASNQNLDTANQNLKTTNEKLDLAVKAADKAAAAEKLAAEKEREATALALTRLREIEKANELLESIFTDVDPRLEQKGGPLLIERLTKRLLAVADKLDTEAIRDPLTVARLQTFLGNTLLSLGEYVKAIELHQQARRTREKLLGPDHRYTLISMGNLAEGYRAAGKLDLALPLFEETLKLTNAKLGPDHPDTLTSMGNLASGYQAAGKLDLALPLFEETLKVYRAKLGLDHPDTLASMNNLAGGYQAAGKLDLALPLYEETLKLYKGKLGPDHPNTLQSMNNLATGYRDAGKLDLALPLLEETLKLKKGKLGPDHPSTLTSMNNLAMGYQAAGKLDLALPLLEETLKLKKGKLGPDHPDTLPSMNNLALGYQAAGKLDLALPLYEETLKLTKAKLGPDHPNTLGSMNNLATGYQAAGKLDLALPLYEETLKLRKARLGPDHPGTLQSMNNLATGYRDAGKLDLALPLFEETLKLQKAKLGPDHPDTLTSMNSLALGYKSAGRLDLALPLYEETLRLRKAKLGPDHPHTLISMNNLAGGYPAAGKLDLALPLDEETLKLRKAKLGPDHPDTLRSMGNLAMDYQAAGKLDLALPLFQEAAAGMEKRRFQHEHAGGIVANLIRCQEQLKQYDQAETWRRKWLAVVKERSGADSLPYAGQLAALGLNLLQQNKWTDAETVLRECLGVREKKQPNAWSTFNTQSSLGGALLGQKKYQDAEPLLKAGYEGMKARDKTIPPQGKVRLVEAAERLVQLYEGTDRKDEAKKWAAVVATLDGKLDATIYDAAEPLTLKGELDAAVPALVFQVRLKAGVRYQMDMVSPDPKALDPYLYLQDSDRKTLAEDDNSGGNLNARITFRAPANGIYRLRATSFNGGRGPFTLTVRPFVEQNPSPHQQ